MQSNGFSAIAWPKYEMWGILIPPVAMRCCQLPEVGASDNTRLTDRVAASHILVAIAFASVSSTSGIMEIPVLGTTERSNVK